jgi:hypothetical protein
VINKPQIELSSSHVNKQIFIQVLKIIFPTFDFFEQCYLYNQIGQLLVQPSLSYTHYFFTLSHNVSMRERVVKPFINCQSFSTTLLELQVIDEMEVRNTIVSLLTLQNILGSLIVSYDELA